MTTNCAKWLEAVCATLIKSAGAMTAPQAREQNRPPSPPDRLPPRGGGRPSSRTCSAAGRPAGLARLAGARRGLVGSARALAAAALLVLTGALALPATAEAQTATTLVSTVNQAPAAVNPASDVDALGRRERGSSPSGWTRIHDRYERGRVHPDRRRHRLCQQHLFHGEGVRRGLAYGELHGSHGFLAALGWERCPSPLPADTTLTLTKGATYSVVLTTVNLDSEGWTTTGWGATRATGEDAGAAVGWSIADGHRRAYAYDQEVPSSSMAPGLNDPFKPGRSASPSRARWWGSRRTRR